jgi:hypothetical protein
MRSALMDSNHLIFREKKQQQQNNRNPQKTTSEQDKKCNHNIILTVSQL